LLNYEDDRMDSGMGGQGLGRETGSGVRPTLVR